MGVITARPMPEPERAITSMSTVTESPVTMPNTPQTAAPITAIATRCKPVGVVGERHREQQPAELRQRDEREVALVREVERVADVGAEHRERGLVELVDQVEADENDQREQRLAAAHLLEEPARLARNVEREAANGEPHRRRLAGDGHSLRPPRSARDRLACGVVDGTHEIGGIQDRRLHQRVGDQARDADALPARVPAQRAVARVTERGAEPTGHEQQHEQQTGTRREERVLRGEEVLHAVHERGAEHRARDRSQSADHDHREDLQAHRGCERLVDEQLLLEHEQRTRHAGEEARNREREHERVARRIE